MSLQLKTVSSHYIRQTAQRRPITSFVATASLTAFGYASYIEWKADRKLSEDDHNLQSIPRNHYDPNAIANYWEQRPISVAKRVCGIISELGPVAGEYVWRFHCQPWVGAKLERIADGFRDLRGNLIGEPACEDRLGNGTNNSGNTQCDSARLDSSQHHLADNENRRQSDQIQVTNESNEEIQRNLSQKLRTALTDLGPTFVKVGQQLSIRPDLVSPIVLYELQRLCDAVPPFDDAVAMRVLAEELSLGQRQREDDDGNDNGCNQDAREDFTPEAIPNFNDEKEVQRTILYVFEEIPKLVASASLGQVYKARLRENGIAIHDDGSARQMSGSSHQVAIKIQRPDVFNLFTLDLFLLVTYGKVADKVFSILTHQIPYHENFLNGFASGAFMELNYHHEAQNQIYFRENLQSRFGGNNDKHNEVSSANRWLRWPFFRGNRSNSSNKLLPKVIVPAVFEEYSSQKVLVTEWIDGIPLAQAPKEQIRELIPVGVELFLCQLLDIGRFHADPHPGNLYVTRGPGGDPTLCLLDFGLIAHVDENASTYLTSAILNLLQGDYESLIAHDAKRLGFLPHDMDTTELQPLLKKILKEGLVKSGSNLHDRRRNLMAISNELNEVFFRYPFSVPPFFALVTRGLGLLEGIALSGDPNFDIFKASYPYTSRRAMEMFNISDYGRISRNLITLQMKSSY